jgi:hypothetical protein
MCAVCDTRPSSKERWNCPLTTNTGEKGRIRRKETPHHCDVCRWFCLPTPLCHVLFPKNCYKVWSKILLNYELNRQHIWLYYRSSKSASDWWKSRRSQYLSPIVVGGQVGPDIYTSSHLAPCYVTYIPRGGISMLLGSSKTSKY